MPSSSWIVGRATLTMLVSRIDMNMPTMSTPRAGSHDADPAGCSFVTAGVGGAGRRGGAGFGGAGRTGAPLPETCGTGRATVPTGRTSSTCWVIEGDALPTGDLLLPGRTSPSGKLIPTSVEATSQRHRGPHAARARSVVVGVHDGVASAAADHPPVHRHRDHERHSQGERQ